VPEHEHPGCSRSSRPYGGQIAVALPRYYCSGILENFGGVSM
jgi:hypothetical protein